MTPPRRFLVLVGASSGKPFIVDVDAIISVGAWGRDNNVTIVMYECGDRGAYALVANSPEDIISAMKEEDA
jgi:hypothetical protein